ncbi:hypothetical protein M405DRAFT_823324 [Rhizopogon salebrosus TDB-379]|nr:hypothetical protein M405DRAFT_823324 [Rhizopogon salebrosus TDB-379]
MSYYRRCSGSNSHQENDTNQENSPPALKLPPEALDHCWGYLSQVDLLQVLHVCCIFLYSSRPRIFQSPTLNLSPEFSADVPTVHCLSF